MLSLFISRASTTPLATFALQDLERICQLFRRAASVLPFCAKVLVRHTICHCFLSPAISVPTASYHETG